MGGGKKVFIPTLELLSAQKKGEGLLALRLFLYYTETLNRD